MHTISGGHPAADLGLGIFCFYAGRTDEAAAAFDRLASAGLGPFSAFGVFLGAAVRGDRATMDEVLADEVTRGAVEMDKELSWFAAIGFASVGETEEALHWLSGAIEMGIINHHFFAEIDPFLAKLRGNSRFEALMERAQVKQREIEAER
jgi:hypothetical protein